MANSTSLVFFGHHKCATQYTKGIIREVCTKIRKEFTVLKKRELENSDIDKFIDKSSNEFIVFENTFIRKKTSLNITGFHIIRDPRDIIVSAYFSHRYSHPINKWKNLEQFRAKLKETSIHDGLFLEMEFRKFEFQSMINWDYSNPYIYESKMENLIVNPYEEFVKIFQFMKILNETSDNNSHRINIKDILFIVYNNRFSKLSKGRENGIENIKSHYRKGISGDWKNYFTKEHVAYFKKLYPGLLVKLGYEKNDNW